MKRLLLVFILIVALPACSNTDVKSELTSTIWNVVATNGEAYTAEFANDTATFKIGELITIGMGYEVNKDEITLIEKDEEEHVFTIEKRKDELIFKAKTEEVKERFGDLTLSPKK